MRLISWGKLATVGLPPILAALLLAPAAAASPPVTASGTFTVTVESFNIIREPDGNLIATTVEQTRYTGGLTGTAIDTFREVGFKTGRGVGHGTEVCSSCTIGGRTGGYTAVFNFKSTATGFTGRQTFTGGTGGLAGLRAGGPFQNTGGPLSTYSYSYHFQP